MNPITAPAPVLSLVLTLLAAAAYLLLSLVVGARLAVGRVAAERLEEECGLPEGLDFDSRAWSAVEIVRHLALVLASVSAAFCPFPWRGFPSALIAGGLLIVAGRVCVALLASRWREGMLRRFSPLVVLLDRVVGPLVLPLARTHESLGALRRRNLAHEDEDAREEQLEEVIRDAEEEGLIEREQTALMREIVDVGDSVAREVMTPRTEIDAVGAESSLEQVLERFGESHHSRLPVYEESLDQIIGAISVRDLVPVLSGEGGARRASTLARDLMRPVPLVPGSKKVLELLRELQETRQHLAVVVDEYGGTAGLVTLEDLLEEIVGEIRDEYEPAGEEVRPDGQGGMLADGLMAIDDLAELTGVELPDEDVETIGGLVLALTGRIPRVGERVQIGRLKLEVAGMEGRRISTVRITLAEREQEMTDD